MTNNTTTSKSTSSSTTKYKLYWLYDNRIPNQDPLTDGYIGVTGKSLASRLKGHKKLFTDGVKPHFTRLGSFIENLPEENLVMKEIIWSRCEENMALLERAFRPTGYIGWNTHPGGKKITKNIKTRPFEVFNPKGESVGVFNNYYEVRAAGFHDANVSEALNKPEKRKTFDFGHTAKWVN